MMFLVTLVGHARRRLLYGVNFYLRQHFKCKNLDLSNCRIFYVKIRKEIAVQLSNCGIV